MVRYGSADSMERQAEAVTATSYGSADAAERALTGASAAKAYAEAEAKYARTRSARADRTRAAANRAASARARAMQQKAAQARAQAALRAVPRRAVQYQAKESLSYDATDYLAKKYGLNRQIFTDPRLGPEYRKLYGLTADEKATPQIDAKGHLIQGGAPTGPVHYGGGKYGSKDTVYVGYYNSAGPVNPSQTSPSAIDYQQAQHQRHDLVISEEAAKGMIHGWSPQKVKEFQISRGIKPTGFVDPHTKKIWSEGVNGAQQYYQFGGARVTPEEYLDVKYGKKKSGKGGGGGHGGRGGGGGGGGGGASSTVQRVTVTNRTELQRALNQMFEDKLGRKATDQEVTRYLTQVNSEERKHPQVASVDGAGNSTVTGGVDPMQVAENFMTSVQGGDVGTRLAGVDYFASAMRLIGGGDL